MKVLLSIYSGCDRDKNGKGRIFEKLIDQEVSEP